MTADRIIWEHADGAIEIMYVFGEPMEGESVEQWLDGMALQEQKKIPHLADAQRVALVDADAMPASRRFRNCWRHNAGRVAPDTDLAREQVLAEVRAERTAKFDAADREMNRLSDIGTPEQIAALKVYRQALRDLPAKVSQDLAAAKDHTEVASYIPTWPTKPA